MVSFKPVKQVVDWLRHRWSSPPDPVQTDSPELKPRDFKQKADRCLEGRDIEGAIHSFQAAIAHFPNYVYGYVRLAELLERCDRLDESEATATAGLQQDPNDRQRWQLLQTRGFVRVQRGNLAGGSADLREAMTTSDREKCFYDAANRLASLQQYDLAIRFLQENQTFLCDRNLNTLRFWRPMHHIQWNRQIWQADLERVRDHEGLRLQRSDKQPMFELAVFPPRQFPPSQYSPIPRRYEFPVENPVPLPVQFDDLDGLLETERRSLFEDGPLDMTLYREQTQSVVTLPDAVVGTVGEEKQFIVSQQGFHYDREKRHGLNGIGYTVLHPVTQTVEMGYFLTLAATDNYYHQVLDVVSSLVQYPLDTLDCPLFVFSQQWELTRKLVRGAGIDSERVQPIDPQRGILVKTGLAATGELDLDTRVGVMGRKIGEKILQDAGMQPADAERLYISRRRNLKRSLQNEVAVEALLQELGFRIVFGEDESFETQVALARGAKVVMAPHGAGLINVLFAPVGTTVIELFPEAYPSPLFGKLSQLCGHRYYPLVGEMTDTADFSRQETFDWWVDCDRLRELLRRVLGI